VGAPPEGEPPLDATVRQLGGYGTHVARPEMGALGTPLGRNFPYKRLPSFDPSSFGQLREIADRLMERRQFIPARAVNLLFGTWIQFMTHDWFDHVESRDKGQGLTLPPLPGQSAPVLIPGTEKFGEQDGVPLHVNTGTHWWDGSQVYGDSAEELARTRDGTTPFLATHASLSRRLPIDDNHREVSGFTDNWWMGLTLLHTLFTLEHNAIARALQREYPTWPDERIFHTARLVVAALMAKIHTVEWSTILLSHPVSATALNTNWWGLLGERMKRAFGRLGDGEILSGIPGSHTEHHGAPFSLTEEFVAVYRLHSLIPDGVQFWRLRTEEKGEYFDLETLLNHHMRTLNGEPDLEDWLLSFGRGHPGQLVLHNFPKALRNIDLKKVSEGVHIPGFARHLDLAVVDLARDRERRVPRYLDFRDGLRMRRPRGWDDLPFSGEARRAVREVYDSSLHLRAEDIDLQIGLLAEEKPDGFVISDCAFRIFVLMASRRLKSDRFLSSDFRPEVYTPLGIDWVDRTLFRDVVLRHFPETAPHLRGLPSAFLPWR
jgi:hypothetical protein